MRTSAPARPLRRAACLALLGLLAGSGPVWNTNGPLSADGGVTVCAVQPARGLAAFGNVVHNHSSAGLTITDASLAGAADLVLEASRATTIAQGTSFVLGTGSTRPDEPAAKAGWARMEPADSFELDAGGYANIVLAVDNGDAETGTSQGLRIAYEHNNRTYLAVVGTTLVLADHRCSP